MQRFELWVESAEETRPLEGLFGQLTESIRLGPELLQVLNILPQARVVSALLCGRKTGD